VRAEPYSRRPIQSPDSRGRPLELAAVVS